MRSSLMCVPTMPVLLFSESKENLQAHDSVSRSEHSSTPIAHCSTRRVLAKRLLTRSGEVVWDTVVVPCSTITFGLAPT